MFSIGQKLNNGAVVKGVVQTACGGYLILARGERGVVPAGVSPVEWITWRADELGGTHWGHYFESEEEAREDFVSRLSRLENAIAA